MERLWNLNYIKVMTANFSLFFAFYLLTPLLPLYLHETFGATKDVIGLVLSGYTITALLSRPFSGYLVDSFPRKMVLLVSYIAFAIFFAGYLAASTLVLFTIVRTLHGAPFGALTVANSTVAIDVLPSSRRNEGIGYYGLSNNLAMAISPTFALLIYSQTHNFELLFWLAFAIATFGLAVDATVKLKPHSSLHTPHSTLHTPHSSKKKLSLDRFFLLRGWLLGVNMVFFGFCFGVLSNYLAIYGKQVMGITGGTGTWFMLCSVGLILSRLQGGKALRQGRLTQNAAGGILISLVGYTLFIAVPNMVGYYGSAILIGLGNGHMWPAFQNMMISMAHHNERGTANSTILVSWDVGMGLGILLGGIIAELVGYAAAFWTVAAVNLTGTLLYFLRTQKSVRKYLAILLLLFTVLPTQAGNKIYTPRIKSLTSIVNGDWQNRPIMTLNSSDEMVIGFDELSHTYHRMTYHLEHCEADWSTSEDIFESDWLQGFNDNPIEDYQNSINTTVLYTHYELTIPNERCQLKMSGNYRLTVYDEDDADEKVLEVEFYVVDSQMTIGMELTTNTDIDHNDKHQQLSMSVAYNHLRITNLEEQIHTVVMQNWREEEARHNIRPNFISHKGLQWEHNRELIFNGGNEYHKYEVLDVSHPTMGIERISWDGKSYQAYPFPAVVRRNYLTDVDADGAFCIRNSDRRESDYTCDYVWVNYELQSTYQGDIYINGQWTTDADKEKYKMRYDGTRQAYYTAILQKQGYYNYQYLTDKGDIPLSEGNFYETSNRYQMLVYYKEVGGRTWQLVGYKALALR